MKKRIMLTLAITTVLLFACTLTPPDPTPTPNLNTPTNTHPPLVMWTLTKTCTPTLTPSPTQPTPTPTKTFTATPFSAALALDEQPIAPGIYPAFYREGSIYIDLPSGNTQELLHLYDASVHNFPDGSSTRLGANSRDTIVSPDGKFITHQNRIDGFVYNYNLQSKTIQKIPQPESGTSSMDWTGQWSPDGNYLLYALNEFPYNIGAIYIADIEKNSFSRISDWNWVESNPVWSPDFQRIAFDSDISKLDHQGNVIERLQNTAGFQEGMYVGSTDIFVISAICITDVKTCLGSPTKQLTDTGIDDVAKHPVWNPGNGTEIAYIGTNPETNDAEIYLVDMDGNTTNLTNTPNEDEEVFAWSPDGEKLVVRSYSYEMEQDLYILNLSDGRTTQITDSPKVPEGVSFWSPDGEKIAFKENGDDSLSGITIYSIRDNQSQTLTNSINSNFLFWLTVYPDITRGTTLFVSPSGNGIHIRSESNINSSITGKLQNGDAFTITGEYSGDDRYSWWRIRSDQGEGWILQNYHWYLPE